MKVGIFDTETDKLISNSAIPLDKQPRIAEFFGIGIDHVKMKAKLRKGDKIDQLLTIGRPLSDESIRITGIEDDMLKGKPTFKEFAPNIVRWIEGHERIVAHNLSYDKEVVDMQMKLAGLREINWPELICTVEATEYLHGYRLSLTALYEDLFEEKFDNAHRAEGDVTALTRCYIELAKRGIV